MKEPVLKIVAICGCGMGSSVILKMNAEKVLKELNVKANIEVADATSGKGAAMNADLVLIGKELASLFKDLNKPVIQLTNFVDKNELKNKLQQYFESKK